MTKPIPLPEESKYIDTSKWQDSSDPIERMAYWINWLSPHNLWKSKSALQEMLSQAQQEVVESAVYVLTAYDTEKERNGEVIVVDNKEQAFEIEKTLQSIYGVRNVMFSSRKINDIPVVILEALQKEKK